MAAPGLVLADRYRLDACIAAGGVGEVWRATDLALDRRVAVKLLRPRYAQDEEGLARFRAEARHAGSLSHPNIAHVYDFSAGAPPEPGYLVMEFVDGPSLARVLDDGPLDLARTMDVVAQAASGLAAAHRAGLVHRDIKPGNLLAGAGGLIKITDFGIAQAAGAAPVTRTGALIGTPAYLAPERGAGRSGTPASDLYSLGIVAHQCLTGRIPFRGEPLAVVIAHLEQPLPPLPPSVPPAVAALVAELTSKDPLGRPASAAEVAIRAGRLRAALPGGALPGSGAVTLAGSAPVALAGQRTGDGALLATAADLAGPGHPWPGRPRLGYPQPGYSRPGRLPQRTGLPARAGMALAAVGAAGLLGWTVLASGTAPAARHALSRPSAARTAAPRGVLARRPSRAAPGAQAVPVAATSAVARTKMARRRARPAAPSAVAPTVAPTVTPTPSGSPSGRASSPPAPSATPTPATPTPAAPSATPTSPPSATPTPPGPSGVAVLARSGNSFVPDSSTGPGTRGGTPDSSAAALDSTAGLEGTPRPGN